MSEKKNSNDFTNILYSVLRIIRPTIVDVSWVFYDIGSTLEVALGIPKKILP